MKTVIWSPEGLEDLRAAAAYLVTRNPRAAETLVERVFDTVDRLASEQFEGPEATLLNGERVRRWPLSPFRIYYTRELDGIRVVRVYHQAREPISR